MSRYRSFKFDLFHLNKDSFRTEVNFQPSLVANTPSSRGTCSKDLVTELYLSFKITSHLARKSPTRNAQILANVYAKRGKSVQEDSQSRSSQDSPT